MTYKIIRTDETGIQVVCTSIKDESQRMGLPAEPIKAAVGTGKGVYGYTWEYLE